MTAGPRLPVVVRAAVLALLVAAVLPLVASALLAGPNASSTGGPALVHLSSALEKAQRCLQGDGRLTLDLLAPVPHAGIAAALALPPAPAAPPASLPRPAAEVAPPLRL